MKIKLHNIEFESFSDGICSIYTENDSGDKEYKHKNLGYNKRVLGFNRFFTAQANKMNVSKIIRIPYLNNIDTFDSIEIDNVNYDIKLIQELKDTNPHSMDLTLQKKF